MRLYEFDAKKQALKDFEKVLFGTVKGKKEKDTARETKLFRNIVNFISVPNNENKKDAHKALQYLKKFKEIFPNDLNPDAKTVYRGTNITLDQFEKIFSNKKFKKGETLYSDFTYKPKSNIQSWSTVHTVAKNFAKRFGRYNNYIFPAILAADVNDYFIMNSRMSNIIAKSTGVGNENEVIRISKSPLKCNLSVRAPYPSSLLEGVKTKKEKIDILNVYIEPASIVNIKNPSERTQMAAVKKDLRYIRSIVNPTEKVQLYVLKKSPNWFTFIKNPTEKVQMHMIRNSPQWFQFIENPTDKVKKLYFRLTGTS